MESDVRKSREKFKKREEQRNQDITNRTTKAENDEAQTKLLTFL